MRGRKPSAYRLCETDRRSLQKILTDGHLMQRVANRARALLALDRGARLVEIAHWWRAGSLSIYGTGRSLSWRRTTSMMARCGGALWRPITMSTSCGPLGSSPDAIPEHGVCT